MPEDGDQGINGLPKAAFRAPASELPMPKPGDLFAERYNIEKLIGRGGMGEVYLAIQAPLQRKVALKILKPPQVLEDDPNFDARFLREAAAAARLHHPNTITIHDFGQTEEGQLYIVMEFLEGTDLRSVIFREGPFSPARAIHVASQVCKSLREAHDNGIIHRDLKPANILLVQRDEDEDFAKVLDFGLVKFQGETSEITLTGKFVGSPKYTSPEALDRHADLDQRADIYSLGILLYTMLVGEPPFGGDPMQVLTAHLREEPPAMASLNPDVRSTPELEEIVSRCLLKAPSERFQTMGEVLVALQHADERLGHERTLTLVLDETTQGSGSHSVVATSGVAATSPSATAVPRPDLAQRRSSWMLPASLGVLGLGAGLLVFGVLSDPEGSGEGGELVPESETLVESEPASPPDLPIQPPPDPEHPAAPEGVAGDGQEVPGRTEPTAPVRRKEPRVSSGEPSSVSDPTPEPGAKDEVVPSGYKENPY